MERARGEAGELEWEVLQDARSALTFVEGPFVQALAAAVERVTGSKPSFACCPGVLETRVYGALGIPALAFGPGLTERMHGPDEDVLIANLAAAAEVYVQTAAELAAQADTR